MNHYKSLAAAGSAIALLVASQAHGANWLMLQGTEPADAAPRAKVFGAVQFQYQKDFSSACSMAPCTNEYIPPKLVGPDLTSQEAFNVSHALLGARGAGFPLDGKVNYLVLAEFGNSGVTEPSGAFAKVLDASITLNYIHGARIRAGLFKYPGSEEGMQALAAMDYINFSTVGNQMMLERFASRDGADNQNLYGPAQGGYLGQEENAYKGPVGAYRDMGVEVFDSFAAGDWEHSYAVMIGNGNGVNTNNNDGNKDTYLYWSSEKVYGGKGPFREGLKLYAWTLSGKRMLDRTDDSTYNPVQYDRKRSGVGVKYLRKPWRVSAEYMKGEGMIFVGPDKASFDQNGTAAPGGDGANGKASGWYVEGGWYIPRSRWELDLRYDQYNRLEGDSGHPVGSLESEWKAWTVGAQYHFNKKTRLTVNYEMHDVTTPAFPPPGGNNPNNNMDGLSNRVGIQVTALF